MNRLEENRPWFVVYALLAVGAVALFVWCCVEIRSKFMSIQSEDTKTAVGIIVSFLMFSNMCNILSRKN